MDNEMQQQQQEEEVLHGDAPPRKPWFRWIPTTSRHREYYEGKVLESLPVQYKVHQVSVRIPAAASSHRRETEEHFINTLTLIDNEDTEEAVEGRSPSSRRTSKPNLLLLHGMGAGLGIWTLNLQELMKHYRVHAIDIIGFGGSSRPLFRSDDIDHIESIFTESIESWRMSMGIEHFHLLGHSFGGYIAGVYALHYPGHLDHVIFADPWGFNGKRPDFDEWVRSQSFLKRSIFSVVKKMPPLAALRITGPWGPRLVRFRKDIGSKVEGTMDKEHLFDYIFHSNAQAPSAELAFKKLCEDMPFATRPLLERLDHIDKEIPVTFLHGSHSWAEKVGVQAMDMRPTNTNVRILPNAGHHIMWDNPTKFNEFVTEASRSRKKRRTPSSSSSSMSNDSDDDESFTTSFSSSAVV